MDDGIGVGRGERYRLGLKPFGPWQRVDAGPFDAASDGHMHLTLARPVGDDDFRTRSGIEFDEHPARDCHACHEQARNE